MERLVTATGRHIDQPEAELVRRVAEGSDEALADLYDRFVQSVFGAARRLGADVQTAEEIVQETFLVLWNRAETFDPALGSVQSWLLTIARNRTIDTFRAAGRRLQSLPFSSVVADTQDDGSGLEWLVASGELLAAGRPESGPEVLLVGREEQAAVAAALSTLEPDELTPIMLAYREGLSQSEIADTLGWPLGTVKTRTRRALRRLRARLELEEDHAALAMAAAAFSIPSPASARSPGSATAPAEPAVTGTAGCPM